MAEHDENPWDREAAFFDQAPDHGLKDPEVRSRWSRLLGRLVPQSGTALDVGCGTGTLSLLLSECGLQVTGIDSSTRMLAFARRKATAAGARIRFLADDAGSPTLPPGQFDLVLGRHILWALPDIPATLAKWSTLLRPGGRMVLIEGFWHTGVGLHLHQVENALPESMTKVLRENLADDPVLWGGPVADERYVVVAESKH